jgi:hypothetical protein
MSGEIAPISWSSKSLEYILTAGETKHAKSPKELYRMSQWKMIVVAKSKMISLATKSMICNKTADFSL